MEARAGRYHRPVNPDRPKPSRPPPRNVPVVYYLSRNHQLDHPHFVEVPLSSTGGLYLRDVIDRLNKVRGRCFPTMYSWSCKRSYKNGFVWQDLMASDLITPAADGGEYVLKGSELLGQPPAGNNCFGSDWRKDTERKHNSPKNGPQHCMREPPIPSRIREASTQTEDDQPDDLSLENRQQFPSQYFSKNGGNVRDEISPAGSSLASPVRTNSLESLIRADVSRMNNYRIYGKDEVLAPIKAKMKSVNMLMQLITCGSFPEKEHHKLGPVWAYNPRFSHMKLASPVLASSMILGELDFLSEKPGVMEMEEEKRCCSRRAEHKK